MKIKKGAVTIPTGLAIFILFFSVGLISLVVLFGMQYFSSRTPMISSVTPSADGTTTLYAHPKLGYTLTYPSDWKIKIFKSPAGAAVQPYSDFVIYSPDYAVTVGPDQSTTVLKGASIFVRGLEVPDKTIEDRYARNILAQKIANRVTRMTIDGVPSIQYAYSFEGENAINTTLIKNGKWYLIKYEFGSDNDRDAYMPVFEQVMNTFKAK